RASVARRPAPPAPIPPPRVLPRPVVAAYYVDWDETSLASLRQHAGEITHLMPEWLHLYPDGGSFVSELDPKAENDSAHQALNIARDHGLPVLPLLNNYAGDAWEVDALHRLMVDPARQALVISQLRHFLLGNHFQGVNVDLEELQEPDRDRMVQF